MTETVREVERKYDVEPSFRLPGLGGLGGVHAVDPPGEQELSATYFDTANQRLAAHSLTLRRRTREEHLGIQRHESRWIDQELTVTAP